MTVAVAFAGGSGGHLVGNIIANICNQQAIQVSGDGSVHSFGRADLMITETFSHAPTIESYAAEFNLIRNVGGDIVMMHARNLAQVAKHYEKVVYITFEPDDIPTLWARLRTKVDFNSRKIYDIFRAESWPPFEEMTIPFGQWYQDDIAAIVQQMLLDWYWVLPVDLTRLFPIRFKDLTAGTYLDDLAAFLGAETYNKPYIMQILSEYASVQVK